MPRRRHGRAARLAATAALVMLCTATGAPAQRPSAAVRGQAGAAKAEDPLLARVWAGVQRAQQHTSICGSLTETRTSRLLVRPMALRATFCVQGTTGFRVDYTEPEAMKIVYHDGYINVTTNRGTRTEAFEAGSGVSRAIGYFGTPEMDNLRRDFAVTAREAGGSYVLRMEPVASRFRNRTGPITATFDAGTFHITRLEIEGRSGVRSVFDIRIEKVDEPLDPKMFAVYRPGPRKEPRP